MRTLTLIVDEAWNGSTVKHLLRAQLHMAEGLIARVKLRETGLVRNGERVFTNARLRTGDVLCVEIGDEGAVNEALVYLATTARRLRSVRKLEEAERAGVWRVFVLPEDCWQICSGGVFRLGADGNVERTCFRMGRTTGYHSFSPVLTCFRPVHVLIFAGRMVRRPVLSS